jgi:hypothetical protein
MGVSSCAASVSTAPVWGWGKSVAVWGGRLGTLLGPEGTSTPCCGGDPRGKDCGWVAITSNGFSWVVGSGLWYAVVMVVDPSVL